MYSKKVGSVGNIDIAECYCLNLNLEDVANIHWILKYVKGYIVLNKGDEFDSAVGYLTNLLFRKMDEIKTGELAYTRLDYETAKDICEKINYLINQYNISTDSIGDKIVSYYRLRSSVNAIEEL